MTLRSLGVALALAPAVAGCHHDAAPAPKVAAPTRESSPKTAPPPAHTIAECEAQSTRAKPSASGEATVTGADGKPHSLYWTKMEAKIGGVKRPRARRISVTLRTRARPLAP